MSITLYKYTGENNVINKTFGAPIFTATGSFRDDIDILNPTFSLDELSEASIDAIKDCNYMYISEFDRYYFITSKSIPYDNEIVLTGRVDVLRTYATDILTMSAIVERNSNTYNNYLIDHSAQAYNFPMVLTKRFPTGFGGLQYYLTVAGSPATD